VPWQQRQLTAAWAVLREVIIPLYFALIRPHLDAVTSLPPSPPSVQEDIDKLEQGHPETTRMLRSGALAMCRVARGAGSAWRRGDFGWT